MTQPTALECKHAAKQALAILTAAHDSGFVVDLIRAQGDDLPLVTAFLAGLTSGLLKSFDDDVAGAARLWLTEMGRRFEAMTEREG